MNRGVRSVPKIVCTWSNRKSLVKVLYSDGRVQVMGCSALAQADGNEVVAVRLRETGILANETLILLETDLLEECEVSPREPSEQSAFCRPDSAQDYGSPLQAYRTFDIEQAGEVTKANHFPSNFVWGERMPNGAAAAFGETLLGRPDLGVRAPRHGSPDPSAPYEEIGCTTAVFVLHRERGPDAVRRLADAAL